MGIPAKFRNRFEKMEGYVSFDKNPHDTVVRSPSPSFNFIYGNNWGLPFKYATLLWGPSKSGKSWMSYSMVAQLHKDYPDAVAVRFDTEMRAQGQFTERSAKMWGVDTERFITLEVNEPALIFDRIENELLTMIQEGLDIKLIIIDSISGIRGRRDLNAESVDQQQIGDEAATLGVGFKRILPIIRRNNIALVVCAHARDEFDQWQQKKNGHKYRIQAGNAVKHMCEYQIFMERNDSKEGKADILGKEFVDETLTDMMGKAQQTGHKVRAKMIDSTFGPKGRVGEFTIDYTHGIINQHEEVFRLGVSRGLIHRPNNTTYEYNNAKWVGKAAAVEALKSNSVLQEAIISELIEQDRTGNYTSQIISDSIIEDDKHF